MVITSAVSTEALARHALTIRQRTIQTSARARIPHDAAAHELARVLPASSRPTPFPSTIWQLSAVRMASSMLSTPADRASRTSTLSMTVSLEPCSTTPAQDPLDRFESLIVQEERP